MGEAPNARAAYRPKYHAAHQGSSGATGQGKARPSRSLDCAVSMSRACRLDGEQSSGDRRPLVFRAICSSGFWRTGFKPMVSVTLEVKPCVYSTDQDCRLTSARLQPNLINAETI